MKNAFVVTGRLTDSRTITLDEEVPVSAAEVRLTIEPLSRGAQRRYADGMREIRARQQARGFQPSTREEVEAYLAAEKESWD